MKDRKEVEPVGRGDVKDLGVLEKANTIIRTSYVGKVDSFLIKENKKKELWLCYKGESFIFLCV